MAFHALRPFVVALLLAPIGPCADGLDDPAEAAPSVADIDEVAEPPPPELAKVSSADREPLLDLPDPVRTALRERRGGGAEFWPSWQPTQESTSPGMAVIQLRINCKALPSASSGWMERGTLAGTRNRAEPSSATGTVPKIRLMSHGPSMPTTPCGPPMFG